MTWKSLDHFGIGMLVGSLYTFFWCWYAPKLIRAFNWKLK
jgi:hypothetical protein